MGTLAASLNAIEAPRRIQCKIGLLLQNLDESDRAALDSALENEDLSAKILAEWLGNNGYYVATDSIRRHRKRQRGGCLCPREN